jgi:hypothetical protein
MGKASWSNSNESLDHDKRGGDPTSRVPKRPFAAISRSFLYFFTAPP